MLHKAESRGVLPSEIFALVQMGKCSKSEYPHKNPLRGSEFSKFVASTLFFWRLWFTVRNSPLGPISQSAYRPRSSQSSVPFTNLHQVLLGLLRAHSIEHQVLYFFVLFAPSHDHFTIESYQCQRGYAGSDDG